MSINEFESELRSELEDTDIDTRIVNGYLPKDTIKMFPYGTEGRIGCPYVLVNIDDGFILASLWSTGTAGYGDDEEVTSGLCWTIDQIHDAAVVIQGKIHNMMATV